MLDTFLDIILVIIVVVGVLHMLGLVIMYRYYIFKKKL